MKLPLLLSFLCLLQTASMATLPSESNKKLKLEGNVGRGNMLKILHQPTNSCVLRKSLMDPLKLGSCDQSDAWTYTPQELLMIQGTYFCLQGTEPGKPVRLSISCTPSQSRWMVVSDPFSEKTHLASNLPDGTTVCLDVDSDHTVISGPCSKFGGYGNPDSDSQWFAVVRGHPNVASENGHPSAKLGDN